MVGSRRNVQRRGGRSNRETRRPVHDESNSHHSRDDRRQSPQSNHPSNPFHSLGNEASHTQEINNGQEDGSQEHNHAPNHTEAPPPKSSTRPVTKRSAYRGQALERENIKRKGKMLVEFTSGGRPLIADQSSKLASEMGKACRDLLPVGVEDWRKFPTAEKQRAWERVKSRLNIDDIMKDPTKFIAADRWMGNLHRNHRCKTKRSWRKIGDAARPKGSNDDDWKKVTEQWSKDIEEERAILQSEEPPNKRTKSMIGRDARGCVQYLHRSGSRSFESRRNEHINQNRPPPNDIEFFKQTRYCEPKPDGTGGWVSQQAAEAYEKMVKMHQDSQSSDKPLTPEEIVDKFMNASNRSDYHPGRGYGPPSIGKATRRGSRIAELEAALQKERSMRETNEQQLAKITQIVQELVSSYPSSSANPNEGDPSPNARDPSPDPSHSDGSDESEEED